MMMLAGRTSSVARPRSVKPLWFGVRGLASSSSGQAVTPDMQASVDAATKKVAEIHQELDDLLTASYGASPETAPEYWMQTFYVHRDAQLTLPAIQRLVKGNRSSASDPTTETQYALFTAEIIKTLDASDTRDLFARFCMLPDVTPDFVLSAFYAADTEASRECFDKLVTTVSKHSSMRAFSDLADHVQKVPLIPLDSWPIPTLDTDFQENWKTTVSPYEITGPMARVKESVDDFHDWGLLCTSLLLEASWASFYHSGDESHVRRVMELALPWSDHDELGVEYILSLDKPLPKALLDAQDVESIKLQVARIAMWSLLMNSRPHSGVTSAVATQCLELSDTIASHGPISDDVTLRRLSLYPSLLHLFARARLDSQ